MTYLLGEVLHIHNQGLLLVGSLLQVDMLLHQVGMLHHQGGMHLQLEDMQLLQVGTSGTKQDISHKHVKGTAIK